MKLIIMLLGSLVAGSCSRPMDDTAAIKQVLEKESATWRAGDVPGHAACWHIQPYSRVLVSTADGKVLDIPPALLVAPSPSMGQGGTAVNTNYKISVAGTTAWVSHNEESTTKAGQKTYSYEFRMLEKLDNQWKLVGQSIHLYKR
ncbi:MAG: nuclear transport factor 2 family protein [Hymenobacter sp.]|nr:MAG: nuclear transport factor 2 family protein [Hymenobacter sp.]